MSKQNLTSNATSVRRIVEFFENTKPVSNTTAGEEELWRKRAEFLDLVSMQNHVVVFVWNPYSTHYLYMSDKIRLLSGLEPASYLAENGLQFSMSRLHPNQIAAVTEFSKLFIGYRSNNMAQRGNLLFTFTFLYKGGDEKYLLQAQRITPLEWDEAGNPTLYLSLVSLIGHVKKPDTTGAAINDGDKVLLYTYNNGTNSLDEPKTFTDQEKKILELLSIGYNTKQIAQALFISPQTVNTHRKNIIKKTDTIDTTAAVAYAKLINLIK